MFACRLQGDRKVNAAMRPVLSSCQKRQLLRSRPVPCSALFAPRRASLLISFATLVPSDHRSHQPYSASSFLPLATGTTILQQAIGRRGLQDNAYDSAPHFTFFKERSCFCQFGLLPYSSTSLSLDTLRLKPSPCAAYLAVFPRQRRDDVTSARVRIPRATTIAVPLERIATEPNVDCQRTG